MNIAIVASAIKINYWKSVYEMLSKNNTDFHIVFVGHVNPIWKIPDNFTYIYSDKSPSACLEIAYRYAYKNLNSQYIMNIADDLIFKEGYLDYLIQKHKELSQDFPNRLLEIGSISEHENGRKHNLRTWFLRGHNPALVIGGMCTTEDSKKIGGIDKIFKRIYCDVDRTLRLYEMGGMVVPLYDDTFVVERLNNHGLLKQSKDDKLLIKNIWDIQEMENGNKIYCSKKGNETHVIKEFYFKRKNKVIEYTDEELF